MASLSAAEARKRLYALIDEVDDSHEPVLITGMRGNAPSGLEALVSRPGYNS